MVAAYGTGPASVHPDPEPDVNRRLRDLHQQRSTPTLDHNLEGNDSQADHLVLDRFQQHAKDKGSD